MQRIFFILFFLTSLFVKGQNIFNGSFEQWQSVSHYEYPQSWIVNDETGFSGVAVLKTADAQSGNYALKVSTLDTLVASYATLGLSYQDTLGNTVFRGVPFSATVDTLRLYIKADIQPGDAAIVFVQLSAGGIIIDAQQVVVTGSYSSWTLFKVGINPQHQQPDSIFIGITSSFPFGSPFQPAVGSWIMADNIVMTLGNGTTQYLVPNFNFENWDTLSTEEPTGWFSDNYTLQRHDTTFLNKTTSAAEGNLALKVTNVHLPHRQKNGFLTNSAQNLFSGGVPFNQKPQYFSAAVRYYPSGQDSAYIRLIFYSNGTEIGSAIKYLSDTVDAYTYFTQQIYMITTPDTLRIEISSGMESGSVLYIDDLHFLCAAPPNILFSVITDSSAVLHWQAAPLAESYELEYGQEGFIVGQGTIVQNITDTAYTLNSLSSLSSYDVYIRSLCGNEYSDPNGPFSFSTLCGTFTAPLFDNFESTQVSDLPECWQSYKSTSGVVNTVDWETATSGSKTLYMSVSSGDTAMFISPRMHNSLSTLMLTVQARRYMSLYDAILEIGTVQSPNDCSSFIADTAISLSENFILIEHYFNFYQGNHKHIALRLVTDNFAQAVLDDITISLLPTCLPALNLDINTITDSSVFVTWDAIGSATAWDIKFGPAPLSQHTPVVVQTSNSGFSLSGLQQNTNYELLVRARCGVNDSSAWSAPVLFHTLCGAYSLPFSNNFEIETPYTLPDCWLPIVANSGVVEIIDWNIAASGLNSLRLSVQNANDSAMAVLPILNTDLQQTSLTFYARKSNIAQSAFLIVGTSSGGTTPVLSPLDTIQLTDSYSAYYLFFFDYLGNDRRVFFSLYSDGGFSEVYLDDIGIDSLPSCLYPFNIEAANVTNSSASINWLENGTATQWKVRYGLSPLQNNQGFEVFVTTPDYTLLNLLFDTVYDVYVSSICMPGDTSTESLLTFSTLCEPFVVPFTENFDNPASPSFPLCWYKFEMGNAQVNVVDWSQSVSGQNSLYMYTGSGSDKAVLVMPWVTNPLDTLQIRFNAKKTFWSNTTGLIVGAVNDANNLSSFVPLDTIYVEQNFEEFTHYFNFYQGNDKNIALMLYTPQGGSGVYIDDIRVSFLPSCIPVSHLVGENITDVSADITWLVGNNETAWQLVYGPRDFDVQTQGTNVSVTSTAYQLTNLVHGTSYDVYVKADCGGSQSEYKKISFTTTCNPFTTPFTEDFETVITPELPNCWGGYTRGQGEVKSADFNQSSSGIHSINFYMSHDSDTASLILPQVNVSLDGVFLRFKARREFWAPTAMLEIAALDANNLSGTWEPLDTVLLKTTFESFDYYFNDYQGVAQNIGLRLLSSPGSGAAAYADDIEILSLPSCIPVSKPVVSNITDSSAYISWVQGDNEVLWRVQYGPEGFNVLTEGVLVDSLNQSHLSLLNLNNSTSYDAYISARCGAADLSINRKVTFRTDCLPFDVPVTVDFETLPDDAIPVCWKTVHNNYSVVQTVDWFQSTSGSKSLYLKKYQADTLMLISPEMLRPLDTLTIGFMAKLGSGGTSLSLVVGTMNDYNDLQGFLPVDTFELNSYFKPCNSYFLNTGASQKFFAIKAIGNGVIADGFIDDIVIDYIDACNAPANINIQTPDYQSAAITWTQAGTTGPYTISYGTAGFDVLTQGTQVNVPSGNSHVITGLTSAVEYDVYIMSDCGLGSLSDWRGPFTFRTPLHLNSQVVSNNLCYGNAQGKAYVTPLSGSAPYMFEWATTPTQYGDTAFNLHAGTYAITVTDAYGFLGVISVQIEAPDSFSILVQKNNVSCYGLNNGNITLNVNGGTAPYSCLWNNGTTGVTRTNLTPGNYSYTLTDNNNCTTLGNIQITQPTEMFATTVAHKNVTCRGYADGVAAVAGTGGTPPYSYIWNTNPVVYDSALTVLSPGTYLVTVSDANGCLKGRSFFITQSASILQTNLTVANISCPGYANGNVSAGAFGGTAPYTFGWNTGEQNQIVSNLDTGTYIVTVTDANNCVVTDTAHVFEPEINISSQNVTCPGAPDGYINVTLTRFANNISMQWTNNVDSNATVYTAGNATYIIISNILGGTYYVTISDGQGCLLTDSVTITENPPINLSFTVNNLSCFNDSSGNILAEATGSFAPFAYQWSSGKVTPYIHTLHAGTYVITVTDTLQCSKIDSVTVTQPLPVSLQHIVNPVLCYGGSNGSIEVQPSGGTVPYTYLWNNSTTDSIAANLSSGFYSVTVTDNKGCKQTGAYSVIQPAQPLLITNIQTDTVTCFGDATGNIFLTVAGGTPPYNYLWSNGQTTETASNLTAGTYSTTVSDAAQCAVTDSITVGGPAIPFTNTFEVSVPICPGGTNGVIVSHTSGGQVPLSFQWSTGSTDSLASGLMEGLYFLTVTDGFACELTDSVYLEAYVMNIVIQGALQVFEDSTANYNTTNTGIQYLWVVNGGIITSGQGTQNIVVQWDSAGTGIVYVEIIDTIGCTFSGSEHVDIIPYASIEDYTSEGNLHIYPNPFKNYITIEFMQAPDFDEIVMYNVLGVEVQRYIIKATDKTLDLPVKELSTGTYYLRAGNLYVKLLKL